MADYVLEIKLENNELQKQLKQIQGAFKGAMGGSAAGGKMKDLQNLNKLFEPLEKMSKIVQRQAPLRRGCFESGTSCWIN